MSRSEGIRQGTITGSQQGFGKIWPTSNWEIFFELFEGQKSGSGVLFTMKCDIFCSTTS